MSRSRFAPAGLLALAALLVPAVAAGQPDAVHAHAEILSAEGDKHYALTEYEQAIASYKEAYRLVPAPLLLFNIARSYRLLGACQQARTFFKNYLSTGHAEYRERAEQRVAAIDASTDDKCVAGKVVDAVVAPADRVEPVGSPLGDTSEGAGAGAETSTGTAASTPPSLAPGVASPRQLGVDPPLAPHRGRTKRVAGLVTLGVGVALAGTGGYFSSQAGRAARDVEDACADGCVADDVAARDADGRDAQRNATIFYGAAGVAVAAGATLVVWGWLDDRTPARDVALVPTRSGALAVASWSF